MSYKDSDDIKERIDACRTCGVYFLTNSNFLRSIFSSVVDGLNMIYIRMQLEFWGVEVTEGDDLPQYICTGCIHEFQKLIDFRQSCIEVQEQMQHFYNMRQNTQIRIKAENPEEKENIIDFIYVDDVSQSEYDNKEICNISHAPFKEEIMEENSNSHDELVNATITNTNLLATEEIVGESVNCQSQKEGDIIKCSYIEEQQNNKHNIKLPQELRNMECHICGKVFINSPETRLRFHFKWHKLNTHRKCTRCSFYCSSREALKEHIRATHTTVPCEICNKLILSKGIKHHIESYHNADIDKDLPLQDFNITKKEGNNTENGTTTNESFTSYTNETKSNDDNPCMDNDNSFIENTAIFHENDTDNNLDENNFYCIHCHQAFCDEDLLSLHVRQKHTVIETHETFEIFSNDSLNKINNANLEDDYDNSPFYNYNNNDMPSDMVYEGTKEMLTKNKEDMSACESLFNYGCAQCAAKFESVEQLQQHYDDMHSKKAHFNCEVCGRAFALKFSLNRHLRKAHKLTDKK